MPEELLALPNLQAPVDVPIVVGSAIAPLDAALTVTALPGPIPAGTPISLTTGTGATLRTLTVFTAAHAGTNATTILIEPVSALQIQKAMKDPGCDRFPDWGGWNLHREAAAARRYDFSEGYPEPEHSHQSLSRRSGIRDGHHHVGILEAQL